MARANEIHELPCGAIVWQAYEPAVKCDLSSCAWRPESSGRSAVLVDPISLTREAFEELEALIDPVAIVLTNGNHERSAKEFASRFGVPVYAHSTARGEVEASRWFESEAATIEDLQVHRVAGASPGEVALYSPARGGTMIFGDAVIHFGTEGPALLPGKYCEDPKRLPLSLRSFLAFPFETALFAHGTPLLKGAREKIAALLQ